MEFNEIKVDEFAGTAEQQRYDNETTIVANPTFEERIDVEKSTPTVKTTKAKFDYKKLISAIMTVVMAGVGLGVSVVLPVADANSPLNDLTLSVLEFGAHYEGFVFFHFEIGASVPFDQLQLTARLYNDFTERTIPLVVEVDSDAGYVSGEFEGLKVGVTYNFAIVGKTTLGTKEVFSYRLTIPHPIEDATAQILECNVEVGTIYYYVEVYAEVPTEIVLMLNDEEIERTPFDNTSGGMTDGNPDVIYSGEMSGVFENLPSGIYTVNVEGTGLYGKQIILATQQVEVFTAN